MMSQLQRAIDWAADVRYAAHPLDIERALVRPRLLTEKIFHKLAMDRDPRMVVFADKVAVRDYVAQRVGASYLTGVHMVAASPHEIDWNALPETYVAKASHGSGGNIVVSPYADPEAELPRDLERARWGTFAVRRDRVDPARATALFDDWLARDFSTVHSDTYPEWCYRDVPRRILIEEYLDAGEVSPPDVKFFMLNGRCEFIQAVSSRFGDRTRDILSPDWRWLRARLDRNRSPEAPRRPVVLEEMLDVATRLAAGVDFVRVDLYEVSGRVVFGELTNYPEAGRTRFRPTSFDRRMGRRLTLSP